MRHRPQWHPAPPLPGDPAAVGFSGGGSGTIEGLAHRALSVADAWVNRLYGWRHNPLYQSGTIVVALYLVLLVTGLWLLLFYRVGSPWASVNGLTANVWTGNWVRGLHRYASDAAVLATAVHALRMFAQGRNWGARTLAWVSGCVLLLLLFVCGWTGYVMVWDTFGAYLAREGARMIDALPILSEPTGRAFSGEQPVPGVFFFLNLFAHISIPLAMGAAFWLHVKRLARPAMLPPRPLMWTVIGALTALAVVRPLVMAPEADPLVVPDWIPVDVFFAFWIPVARRLGGGSALLLAGAVSVAFVSVPWWVGRRAQVLRQSQVDESICVGCVQCSIDCPYGAITMVGRVSRRSDLVARVDPDLCVACGICAGSCAPMGVGPPGRTGRDQLAAVRVFLTAQRWQVGRTVVVCCDQGTGTLQAAAADEGALVYAVDCVGNVHTSVIEHLIGGGAAGVLVLGCPPRDCRSREGPRWLHERMYHDREAELQPRVDRRRVRLAYAGSGDWHAAVAAVREFMAAMAVLGPPAAGDLRSVDDPACRPVPAGEEQSA